MTKAQNIKFLMDLGIPEDKAKKMSIGIPDTGVDELPTKEFEEALTSAVDHQRELYTNSDDYKTKIKEVKTGVVGEIYTKVQKKIIAISGLTPEEVKDKNFEQITELAWTKAGKSGNKSLDELQEAFNKANDELKRIKEEEIPAIRQEVDNEKLTFRTDTGLLTAINTLKIRKGFDVDDLIIVAKNKALKAGYKLAIDDKGNITFTNEDGSKINTEDKRSFMDAKSILNKFLDGYIEKSGGIETEEEKKKRVDKHGDGEDKNKANLSDYQKTNLSRAEEHAKNLGE